MTATLPEKLQYCRFISASNWARWADCVRQISLFSSDGGEVRTQIRRYYGSAAVRC